MRNIVVGIFILIVIVLSGSAEAEIRYSDWEADFKNCLALKKFEEAKRFFSDDFADAEIETWRYQIQRGFLDYHSTTIFRL